MCLPLECVSLSSVSPSRLCLPLECVSPSSVSPPRVCLPLECVSLSSVSPPSLQVGEPVVSLVPHSFNVESTTRSLILVARYITHVHVMTISTVCTYIALESVTFLSSMNNAPNSVFDINNTLFCSSEAEKMEWIMVSAAHTAQNTCY